MRPENRSPPPLVLHFRVEWGHEFDAAASIAPSVPNRAFWQNTYRVALDDLSALVAPQRVVICEGSRDRHVKAFDARCYNELFVDESPETLFVSQGGATEIIRSEHLIAILESVAQGINVHKVIDRDDMSARERADKIKQGTRVLRRRELEDYLYDPAVLRTFLKDSGCKGDIVEKVLNELEALLEGQDGPEKVKDVSQELLECIRTVTRLPNLGNDRKEFALQHLVPALRGTPDVYGELREDVLGS